MSFKNPQKFFDPLRYIFFSQKQRLLKILSKLPNILALLYLIPAILYFIAWTHCSGWVWVCSQPSLIIDPWDRWTGWNANEALEPFWIRIFSLGVIALNTCMIYSVGKGYEWMYRKLRNNPPRLVGTMLSVTYTLCSLYISIDVVFGCPGWFCDLAFVPLEGPWLLIPGIDGVFFWGGRVAILIILTMNAYILYIGGIGFTRLAQKMRAKILQEKK